MTRNVLVCCLDTVRQDYFARFAPRLRERADVSFPGCRAASGWSVPSHASMVTGALPHEHDVHVYRSRLDSLDRQETIFGDLPDHTALGASANVYASSAFGFDALFDRFVDVSRDHRFADGFDVSGFVDDHPEPGPGRYVDVLREAVAHENPAKSTVNAGFLAIDQAVESGPLADAPTPFDDGAATIARSFSRLAADAAEPFVGFCNFMEAHEPHRDTLGYDSSLYDVPRGWRSAIRPWDVVSDDDSDGDTDLSQELERYRSAYGAAIEYLDRKVAAFVDDLLRETDCETTVIVTADHGENLGTPADSGAIGHVTSLSEGVLNVPLLLINPPDGYPEKVSGVVSHRSLRKLIRGLARGETPDITGDRTIAEVIGPTPGNDPLLDHDPDRWDRALRAVYDGDRKIVWDDARDVTTYELDSGRPCWQQRSPGVDDRKPPAVDAFDDPLDEYRADAIATADGEGSEAVSDDVADRLSDLGYR